MFSTLDLFLEGALPVIVATTALLNLKSVVGPTSLGEALLITSSMIWYETASHTGKEAPIVSYFPYFAPVCNLLGLDDRIIEYHTRHHNYGRGLQNGGRGVNLGISPFIDKAMGSYKIELPKTYEGTAYGEESYE